MNRLKTLTTNLRKKEQALGIKQILIFENSSFANRLYDFFLELGIEARIASNETEYSLALENSEPELIFISDMYFTPFLLSLGEFEESPLIFLLMQEGSEELQIDLVENLGGFVFQKSFSFQALLFQINQALEKQKLSQKTMQLEKELEKVLESRSQFINQLSINLQAPLDQLVQFTHIGLQRMHRKQFTQVGAYLAEIKMITEEVVGCIQELKEITLLKSGESRFHLEEIDMMEFLRGIKRQFQPIMDSRDICLNFQNQVNFPCAKGDFNQLAKVMNILLKNILKRLPENSEIRIRTQMLDSKFKIIIHDSGWVLEEKPDPQIFNFFEPQNMRDQKERMGFGLSICRELMLGQNGNIQLEQDELNKELKFILTLPLVSNFFEN